MPLFIDFIALVIVLASLIYCFDRVVFCLIPLFLSLLHSCSFEFKFFILSIMPLFMSFALVSFSMSE